MITERPINPGQLTLELGGVGLRVVGPYPDDYSDEDLAGKTKVCYAATEDGEAPPDDEALTDAVDAHVADPEWVDPDYVPPPPAPEPLTADELTALRALLGA